jgi:hypothetical protein
MILTNYFIKKKVQHLASGTLSRKHEFCTLEDAKHILVLFHASDRDVVEPCLDTLRKQQKKVDACVYVADETVPEMGPSYLVVHSKKDLDAWNSPKDAVVKNCKALKADILIDLTQPNNYPMQYLLLQHPCRFKVGIKQDGADLYDLAISVTERDNIKQLFEHILFYLRSIRSK